MDIGTKRIIFRGLSNQRQPSPLSSEFMRLQDEILSFERDHKIIVDVNKLAYTNNMSIFMGDITTPEHRKAAGTIRNLLAVHAKNEDLINIGAYVKGADPVTDQAINYMSVINQFLQQKVDEKTDYETTVNALMQLGNQINLQ